MKLFAISDLHVGADSNRAALATLAFHPDDWLILAGDLGETIEQLEAVLSVTVPRFAKVFWVPGNHELWTHASDNTGLRGAAKYDALVAVCRARGVLTPEDPYVEWPGTEGPPTLIAPLFTLYDYTFRPDSVSRDRALDWAMEDGVLCTDEVLLHPDPYPSREAWCHARCDFSERRLGEIPGEYRTVLVDHFPLRRDLAVLPRVPRFSLWCGTTRTEDWHVRFRARAVVQGHLHIRGTRYRDGVAFDEVSVGYPKQWKQQHGLEPYLRQILPAVPYSAR